MKKISLQNISKSFNGINVLNNINLDILQGNTYCLLGRNGAGKTTLINILVGLIKSNQGSILINNKPIQENIFKKKMGVLVEDENLIEEFDGYNYLKFIGALYGIKKSDLDIRIKDLTDYFFEHKFKNQLINQMSTGMKRKIGICASVLNTPDILILDEPFSGLDPVSSKLLIDFLIKYQNSYRIIFLSSHNLEYVQEIATHIGVLENSELAFSGTYESFTKHGIIKLSEALRNILAPANVDLNNFSWI